MGNTFTNTNIVYPETLKFDRVIDGEAGIYVGVNNYENTSNPLSKQKLSIPNEEFKKLNFFTKTDKNLIYEFESDITLRFYKNTQGQVIYNLVYPQKNINKTKIMNDIVLQHYKKISFNSDELDQIYELINSK